MALHPPPSSGKLIFAPSGPAPPAAPSPDAAPAAPSQQAAQFTKHAQQPLRRADLSAAGPVAQFLAWYQDAQAGVAHPETCTLATAALPTGRVSARMVYLKELDARGWVVYTNLGTSRKAADLFGIGHGEQGAGGEGASAVANPWAALTFWWEARERQVRVEGRVERVAAVEGQAYFDTRARASRIGAWASRQSLVLAPDPAATTTDGDGDGDGGGDDGRARLDAWVREAEARFAGTEQIPLPDFWGGIRIVPERVEFWQGRESRLHDRFVYERKAEGADEWTLERLSP